MKKDAYYYFLEVAACNSINIAATRLHMSQPALSMAIKKMESDLGVQLLERSANGVVLTNIGEKVAEECKKIVSSIDKIEVLTESYREETIKSKAIDKKEIIKLYCSSGIEQTLLAPFLNKLSQAKIICEYENRPISGNILETMATNKCPAVALLQISDEDYTRISRPKEIKCNIISSMKACIIIGQTHELGKQHLKNISFQEILAWPIIEFPVGDGISKILFDKLKEVGKPKIAISTRNINVYNSAITTGIGVALGIAGFSHQAYIENIDKIFIPIRDNIKFHLAFYYMAIDDEVLLGKIRECII